MCSFIGRVISRDTTLQRPSFYTSFLAWDVANAVIQGYSFESKLISFQGIALEVVENLKNSMPFDDTTSIENTLQKSDSSNDVRPSGPTQRPAVLAVLSAFFVSSSAHKDAPKLSRPSITIVTKSPQRAVTVAALSGVLNAESKHNLPTAPPAPTNMVAVESAFSVETVSETTQNEKNNITTKTKESLPKQEASATEDREKEEDNIPKNNGANVSMNNEIAVKESEN